MACAGPTALLRPGLLDGVRVLLASAGPHEAAEGLAAEGLATEGLATLGARVSACEVDPAGAAALDDTAAEERELERAVAAALTELGGGAELLIVDCASLFGAVGGGRAALMWSLQACWTVSRAVANAAFIPAAQGGRVVLLAPAAGEQHARAAVAGLENLARTLGTEWARYRITTVALAPGPAAQTPPGGLATLLAYLASPAGAYFSGCLLDLSGP